MIELYEQDLRIRVAFSLILLAIGVLVGVAAGNLVIGSMAVSASLIVLGLFREQHRRSRNR